MRLSLHPVLTGTLVWSLAGGCSGTHSVRDDGNVAGTGSGAQGGMGDGATAGISASGRGGNTGGGTSGRANAGSGGNATAGSSSGEGGDAGHAGGQSAGTGGDGSGGTQAGMGGTDAGMGGADAAGAAGTSSCPPGQMWCPGCTTGSGLCAVGCPAAACGPCASVESLAECEARTDCHSVFEDPQTCGCAGLGCCAHFARCAENDRADCTGANVDCEAPTPRCEAPAYVVSYSGSCYEGCVDPKDCAPSPPTPCPPSVPVSGAACAGDTQCYYDACPEGGRAIATCSTRVWSVETGTSCTVECSGVGQQCNEGELCLVHAGGALLVECTENGCGTGPILEACAGNCPVTFSLQTGATATCNTCPQGGCP